VLSPRKNVVASFVPVADNISAFTLVNAMIYPYAVNVLDDVKVW
jgi:hypothetical protein